MVTLKKYMRFWGLLLLFCLCWLPYTAQAAVTAELDRNPVGVGETVALTFTSDGIAASSPDFTVLEQDFAVQGSSQSNRIQIINGNSTVQTTWQLELAPRKTGKLTIPAINFGNEQSPVLSVTVSDQPTAHNNVGGMANDDILVEVEAEPKQSYVQQQVIVTQRLLHIVSLQPQASLTHPSIEAGKGSLLPLGDAKNSTLMRNGRNYHVIERRYALMPQQSGEIRLGATTFEGMVIDAAARRDPFGISGTPVKRYSQPLTLQVQPQPTTYQGKQWLPAKSITLNAHWQTPPDKLKAGEPATLTLAIVADGLTAEQLPKLDLQAPTGVKAYTDKPELRNETNNNGVIGVRQENWVVVAPYNGHYTLPAMQLEWWNSKTNQTEVAKLEAVNLVVSGGQAAPANASPPNQAAAVAPTNPATAPVNPTPAVKPAASDTTWSWGWIASSLLLLGALMAASWAVWRWAMKANASVKPAVKAANAKTVWQELEHACLQNQAAAAHSALLQWVDVGWHLQPPTLATLSQQGGAILRAELDSLNNALYGRDGVVWNGTVLLKALQHFKPAVQTTTKEKGLVELYPD